MAKSSVHAAGPFSKGWRLLLGWAVRVSVAWEGKKRKVYAGHRPRALRKGPLTSKLARASPE
eukprot:1104461-Pelagomonas_calceolata.AAC.1